LNQNFLCDICYYCDNGNKTHKNKYIKLIKKGDKSVKIILNSDILYNTQLIRDNLSKNLQELFRECNKKGHIVVIPLTALLEFDCKQSKFLEKKISELEKAYGLLNEFNISFTHVEQSEVIRKPELIELIKKFGVEVIVEHPTKDDFEEAHRRACLHEPPHPPDTKSDEMRDLVIWMIALRFASQDGKALLISRDIVHVHSRGDEEANSVGLIRLKSVEEALEYFDVETPSGILIRKLIIPIWENLLESGLPLKQEISIIGVLQPRFIQGIRGISNAFSLIKLRTVDGETLKANIEMKIDRNLIKELKLSDIRIDDNPWERTHLTLNPNKTFETEQEDFEERIDSLKKILGE